MSVFLTFQDIYMDFDHWSVNHDQGYEDKNYHLTTGEVREIHTNTIEGAWNKFKHHFCSKWGMRRETLQSHIMDVMWRNKYGHYPEILPNFFEGLCTCYPLTTPPNYSYEVCV